MQTIPTEGYWLAATAAMTSLFWVPYIVNRIAERGLIAALWDPHGDTRANAPWADRMMRAHKNAVENLAVFAPLLMLAITFGKLTPLTSAAAEIYFFARLGHFAVFSAGLPLVRVLLFLIGFGCQAAIAINLLT